MSKFSRFAPASLVACALALTSACPSSAQTGDSPTEIKANKSKHDSALAVDFAKELKLSYPSIMTLGARIEQARLQGDPIGLAAAACELSAAETASGKTAALTSSELSKEAAQLAEARGSSAELLAVASLTRDESAKARLKDLANRARSFEENQAAARKEGARSRGLTGTVDFVNATNDDIIQCSINGFPVNPTIRPGQNVTVNFNDGPFNATFLQGIGSDGNRYVKTVGEGPHPFVRFVMSED